MSEQGTPRDEEDDQQQHDDEGDEQHQFDDDQPESPSSDAATAAAVSERGGSVQVADEKPAEESKRPEYDDNDVARAPTQARSGGRQQQGDGRGGGGDDAGTDAVGEQDDGGLQEAAAGQLEELDEPAEQGNQTQQQQQQQQQYDDEQQHQQQQQQHDDDPNYPNSVGTDSAPPSHAPQRQVYDDDGGAEPDADPSSADYNGAAYGFDQRADGVDGGAERPAYIMPDILRVVINREELELEAEEEEERELNGEAPLSSERTPEQIVFVQIIKDNLHHPKPFLGGFRHKYFGTLYHHGATQTARKKKKAESVKFHRETQTIQIVSRSQQTNRERGTQMERSDLVQDHSNDGIIMSRPYFTADELEALRENKAKEIQCFLRQCFAWRRVRRLRETKAEQVSSEIAAAEAQRAKDAAEHALQIQRRMHPRTRQDFAVLFAELEAWRLHETQRIKESGLSADEISIALQELLNKEVKLLQTIDRLKITAARENKWTRTISNLESMSSPKEWCSREGDLIEVETPFTLRAKELVDLYNGLCLRGLSRAQRVDVLLHVKYTVKEFDCELSREIVELIKREEDLLRRQRSEQSLENCRKRLQNLFLHFVNTPTFNPEAQNFQRVADPALNVAGAAGGGAQSTGPPPPALSSSLAKPAMLTKTNTITVATNVAGRIFQADKSKQ